MKKLLIMVGIVFMSFATTGCGIVAWFIPPMQPWLAQIEGESELAKANYSKQVQVQEAKGREEAAEYLAKAEVARAHGVAQANAIIGESLKNNPDYLKWLYIEGLKERNGIETIYVPTEAGLPILEAGKRHGNP
jgi:regulator of protease activity HflC (stomatin/prohibitin superfamily)